MNYRTLDQIEEEINILARMLERDSEWLLIIAEKGFLKREKNGTDIHNPNRNASNLIDSTKQ